MLTKLKITPNLWFDKNGLEAAEFYTAIFKHSAITDVSYYGKEGFEFHHMPEGTVMTVEFTLENQSFLALNGGPVFKFNEAISFSVDCETQEEIDYYWDTLGEGGDPSAQQCGWLKDKFGLSWQIVPVVLAGMMKDKNKEKAQRATAAMMQMKKLDIAALQKAFEGVSR